MANFLSFKRRDRRLWIYFFENRDFPHTLYIENLQMSICSEEIFRALYSIFQFHIYRFYLHTSHFWCHTNFDLKKRRSYYELQRQQVHRMYRSAVRLSLRHRKLLFSGSNSCRYPRSQPHRWPVHRLQVFPQEVNQPLRRHLPPLFFFRTWRICK